MTKLREGQYEMGGIIMGEGTPIRVSTFEPQGYEVTTNDQDVNQSDEMRFGYDYIKPAPMGFEVAVLDNYDIFRGPDFLLPGMRRGIDIVEDLAYEWRGDGVRKAWNRQTYISYKKNGPQKRVYGRPRKFNVIKTRKGGEYIPIVMEFQPVDANLYSDEEFGIICSPSAAGTTPATLVRPSNGGRADTWLRVLLVGPITSPIIKIGNLYTIEMPGYTLGAGKVLEINAYPWERRVIDSDSNTVAARLAGNSAYLNEMKLPPRTSIPVGLSGTGTSQATYMAVLWREAYLAY